MSTTSSKLCRLSVALSAALTVIGASAAPSTHTSAPSEAQARYQQERAACLSGQTSQDQATCLKEAGAALAEARRGSLSEGQSRVERRQNRTDRCKVLTGDERTDCLARMRGEGTTEGSVSGGGILREKVTIVPAPANGQSDSTTK